jgi:N-acetyl-gamma-glutamyl-phosphate reductase common form
MSKVKVSIIGGAGYGAAELLRHLAVSNHAELIRVASKDYVGDRLDQVHRHLRGFSIGELRLEDIPPETAVEEADVVFLAMPHKTTAHVAKNILDLPVRIIDLSGDFRLRQLSDYQRDYAPEHPCAERLGTFVYGLPEMNRDAIRKAKHVASPGCFATCIAMGLLPLAKNGLLNNMAIRTVAMTGSSGSGVHPQAGTHHPLRHHNLKAYKILNHQHRAEIIQTLEDGGATDLSLDFVPISAPLSRGILSISQLDLPHGTNEDDILQCFNQTYGAEPLVHVLAPGTSPEVAAVAGTARVEVSFAIRTDETTQRKTLCCMSALDNLIKGGAGQAVQSFHLMVGADECAGFDRPGLWP